MSSSTSIVLVTGADGQLGRAIVDRFARQSTVHALNRRDLDITDAVAVDSAVARLSPTLIVNCAAFNDVDGAQQQQPMAFTVNGLAPGILARAAQKAGAVFVHFSTDFVFAGREDRAWTEADSPEPQSVYAQSKLVGEWMAGDCRRHYVLRVESLFGGSLRRSTIDRVVAALRAGRPMHLFHDRTVSPSFVDDVAEATWQVVERQAEHGVYHCVNGGATTWLGVGQAVAGTLGLDHSLLVPISVTGVAMNAPRPQFAVLSNEKLTRAGVAMPRWEDAVARYLSRLPGMIPTVVIVGYRAYDELEQCLRSLATHEPEVPVVVVDHAADEARGRRLSTAFSRVTYLPRPENPGFAAGVNYAARHAGPGPLLLVNPDCRIAAPVVAPLTDVLAAHPQAGVVGGLIREGDGALQHSARGFPDITTALGGRTSWLSRVAPDNPLTRRNLKAAPAGGVVPVDWVSGAFTLIRREAFDRLSGFDEKFFLYWEDADFCKRAADAGWLTLYAPVAEAVHLTARASRHAPMPSLWAFHRSAFRYYWKHGSPAARLAAPVVAAGLAVRFLLRLATRQGSGDQMGPDRTQ